MQVTAVSRQRPGAVPIARVGRVGPVPKIGDSAPGTMVRSPPAVSRSRFRHWLVAPLFVAALVPGVVSAEEKDATSTPAAASDKGRIKPKGERQIGARRATDGQEEEREDADPEHGKCASRFRSPSDSASALTKKIDQRIAKNRVKTKKLRLEAIKLLDKFINESRTTRPRWPRR